MAVQPFVPSDTVTRRCLGGVRFRDPLTGNAVVGGLQVSATRGGITRALQPGLGGSFALHDFPGFAATAWPASRQSAPQAAQAFEIRVVDSARRFLPLRMQVALPAWPDPATPQALPPCHDAADGPWIDLMNAPSRSAPAGFQVVCGDLQLPASGAPARWAWLAAYSAADVAATARPLAQAVADADGRFCLLFALPPPDPAALDARTSSFTVRIEARFDAADKGSPPDLCLLRGQASATLLDRWTEPDVGLPLPPQRLTPGQPLVLRSARGAAPRGSVLFLNA